MDSKLLLRIRDEIANRYTKDNYKDFLVRNGFYSLDKLDDDSELIQENRLLMKKTLVLHTLRANYYEGIFQALVDEGMLSDELQVELSGRELIELRMQERRPAIRMAEAVPPSNEQRRAANQLENTQQISIVGDGNVVNQSGNTVSQTVKVADAKGNKLEVWHVVIGLLALLVSLTALATDWFGISFAPTVPAQGPEDTSSTATPLSKRILYQDDFCDSSSPNWKLWDYKEDGFAEFHPAIDRDQCRLYIETTLLETTIPWFRLYESAANNEVGNLSFQDFDLQVYLKLLDAANPDETFLSIHFRIGSAEEGYPNFWLWINNEQEYCFATRPMQGGDLCLTANVGGNDVRWIKDETINPLFDGNTVRLVVYGSTIQVFFNQAENGNQAIGSPFQTDLASTPGGIAFGVRALKDATVRVEYRNLIVYEEVR